MSYAPIYTEKLQNQTSPVTPTSTSLPRKRTRARATERKTPFVNRTGARSADHEQFPIIVHCHLCWDWVWQRPQQFLSRLSQRHKILFVETVAPDAELAAPLARFGTAPGFPNITILRLQFPAWYWHDGDRVDTERRRVVREFVQTGPLAGQFTNPVQWFYDPMAVTAFAGQMDEILTVYDCMDELSKFACAPPRILEREQQLLAIADVVFTGGRRLYDSKSRYNSNCHFYGCGVDSEHFGKAQLSETVVPPDLAGIRKPVLGYFGVIDERMDYQLLAALADANPEWSIAMVGPVMKVDPGTLPQRPNLHWLGKKNYDELPAICRGFDVCMMPFALNEATEFINPTKALEYMATKKPIVSTAVPDVVRNFSAAVKIANSPEEFVALCRQVLTQPDEAILESGLEMVRANSWDHIVSELENHIRHALLKGV